jgi:phosphohistidine swiveling domain-containing protein
MLPLPARYNAAVRELVAERAEEFAASGVAWKDVVFDRERELFDVEDARAIERDALDSGYRFDFSATVSLDSEPDKYKRPDKAAHTFTDGDTSNGRRQVGVGDNVIRKATTVVGPVTMISTVDQVMDYLTEGIPEGTIGVIDDSGGTLTAPIIEELAGVICLGGSVRSHLGILAREYDVPTLMNCRIDTLNEGDIVELEVTAAPPSAEAYDIGDTGHARIWVLAKES